MVPFEGSMNAKIYIVGEAPGKEEELRGKPFVGGAGRILDRLLMEAGLSRKECRIGNVMRVRPPNNNFNHFYHDKSGKEPKPELVEGRRYLREDIVKVKPNIVLCLGNEAMKAVLGHSGVTNWRGSVVWSKELGCKVMVTIHPASLMRNWDYMPLVLFDFKKLAKESESREHKVMKRIFKIEPTFEEVVEWLERAKKVRRLSYDVETSGLHITAVGLADSKISAICIPFTRGSGAPYWRLEEEEYVWKLLKEVLEDERVEKVAQNAQFDNIIFKVNPYHIQVKGLVLDTMCGWHTIYPELPKSLDVLCSVYTDQPYYKHWIHTSNDTQFWTYNAMDAAITFECAEHIEREMGEFEVKEFYYRMVHPLIGIVQEMQERGVKIDRGVRDEMRKKVEREVESLQVKLDKAVGRHVNVMSPKQLKELLYEDLGLPPKYKRGTASVTTDEKALQELSIKYPSPIFDLILKIRHSRKLLGTYLGEKEGKDGRMRCSYVVGGTETGRLASKESVFGTGGNLQNVPKECRKMFVADEGKVLVEADLSQAEARVVAYLSEDERLIRLFEEGGDIHRQNAAWIFNKEVGEVTERERTLAKRLVHGTNYGLGPRSFAMEVGIGEREAKALMEKYFDTFPKVMAWRLKIQKELSRCRTLVTPMGRKRTFFARWGESLFREAYAHIPQSTVADYLNCALIRLKERWKECEVLLQVHDSIIIQCEEGEIEKWVRRLLEAFDIEVVIGGRMVKIPVEVKVGKNWGEMVKWEGGEK